ncbi:hypothetical protein A0H81_05669 [Grifola frondosa]|uniref:Uncharacterized protein n=1 Tax=Grifola frondosa TaxID=5627 RepID=A0A1C7MDG1_GRIFR|nr:hypothetical protein A0H81_05669 [Grifola frondosa]
MSPLATLIEAEYKCMTLRPRKYLWAISENGGIRIVLMDENSSCTSGVNLIPLMTREIVWFKAYHKDDRGGTCTPEPDCWHCSVHIHVMGALQGFDIDHKEDHSVSYETRTSPDVSSL